MQNSTKPPPRTNEPSRRERHANATTAQAAEDASLRGSGWRTIWSVRWLIAAAVGTLIIEAALLLWLRSRGSSPEPPVPNEIALGTFDFSRSNTRDNRSYRGQFDLSVRLSDDLSLADRRHVADERPQLQRAAEEALWRLRPVDFADRRLTRLRDRLQQQLNDALGFEAIAEVLVSNFTIEPRPIGSARPSRSGTSPDLDAAE
jgi:hypothetical protein